MKNEVNRALVAKKKLFLLIPALVLSMATYATTPSTDFSSGCTLAADDATLSGTESSEKFFLNTDSDPHSIAWLDVTYGAAVATWNITATRSCYVSVSLDLGSAGNNKHIFEVKILQGSTERGTVAEGAADPSGSSDGYKDDINKVKPLEGSIFLPEAGEYTIELRNIRGYGKGAVNNVILSYAGGAQVDIPAANIPFGDAIFSTHAWLDKTGTSDSIRFARADHEGEAADASYTVTGSEYVKWNVHVASDGYYKFTANTYCKQGHNYRIMLLSADESSTIHTWQEAEGTGHDHHNEKANWEVSTDVWNIPAGNYVLKVQARAYGRLLSLAGTYIGGAVQTLPCTTDNSEAWFSPKGTRADGMISFTSYTDQWVKWNIAVPGSVTRAYNVALNINNPTEYGHRFSVSFYEPDAEDPFATLTESAWNKSYGTPLSIPMGIVNLDGGNSYIVKVTNSESGAQPKIISLSFTNAGGDIKAISTSENTTLNVADAWFSGCTRDNEKTYIKYPSSGTSSAWIKWNIATSEIKYYDLTVNINTAYAHGFTVAIYEDETAEPVASVTEGTYVDTKGDGLALELGRVNLDGGKNYVVKVTNAPEGSQAKVTSVVFAPVVTTVTALPGTLIPSDAILSSRAWVDTEGTIDSLLFTNRGDEGHASNSDYTTAESGKWKVSVAEKGKFIFTVNALSLNGHNFRISVLNEAETSTIYTKQEAEAGHYDHHNEGADWQVVTDAVTLDAGTYIVKIENYKDSKGRVLNIVAEYATITLDEMAENNSVIGANDGILVDAQLTRSLMAGMYNTICLPFVVSASEVARVFGAAKIIGLTSSSIEEGDFVLNLNFDDVTEMAAGTPYLIKPAANISNPKFLGVTIDKTLHNVVTERANFIGNFVAGTIPAGEDNLFLGANDMLYFSPTQDMPILGMRAYFNIHDVIAGAVRRARIVAWENVVTEIEFTLPDDTSTPNSMIQKCIENGQLLIIREGATYNAFGVRIR